MSKKKVRKGVISKIFEENPDLVELLEKAILFHQQKWLAMTESEREERIKDIGNCYQPKNLLQTNNLAQ